MNIERKPTAQELANHDAEVRASPFYSSMLAASPEGENKVATRGELWSLIAMTIEALQKHKKRLTEIEQRPSVKYLGVWREGKAYGVGNMVTAQGGIWHCNRATMQKPGSSDDWTLACKRGQDARR